MEIINKQEVLKRIAALTESARNELRKAEAIAKETGIGFDFDIDGSEGYFYVYKTGSTETGYDGYWDGWQGSNC